MKKIMIIDAHNMFMRGWIVVPTVNSSGAHIGAIVGMMKMLQTATTLIDPTDIFIVWDGEGGNSKRRQVNENYKLGRKPPKLNRYNDYTSEEELKYNRQFQQSKIIDYLNHFPLTQLVEKGLEADDIISYLCSKYPNDYKIIVSSDKDFCQLINSRTLVYRPISKELLSEEDVLEKFGVYPLSLASCRAIDGDVSDNLPGVKGVGLKSLVKYFPFLSENKYHSIDDILAYAKQKTQESNLKIFEKIVDSKDLIKENYKLMQLYTPNIYHKAKESIDYSIDNCKYNFDKDGLLYKFLLDGMSSMNLDRLFKKLKKIQKIHEE